MAVFPDLFNVSPKISYYFRFSQKSSSKSRAIRMWRCISLCFCAYVLQLEAERILKAAGSAITIERARELVKTMYALTYTKPGHVKPTRVMLRMDRERQELYDLVGKWVNPDLCNA